MKKNDPYEAIKYKEFKPFLLLRFALTFAWTMQFAVIEWEVYSLTKNPLSLGIVGLMEVIPAISMALFAGHIVDQKEKRNLLVICILAFMTISTGLFLLTWPRIIDNYSSQFILYGIYLLVCLGGFVRAFISPGIFSLMALVVPRKAYVNATSWNTMFQQMGHILGPAFGGLFIYWIGVHWSMSLIIGIALIGLIALLNIQRKPILNPNLGEPIFQSLRNGVKFVYKTKEILGALTLDMIAVLVGGAITLAPIFAQDILNVGSEGYGLLRAAPAMGAFLTILLSTRFPLSKNAGLKLLGAIFAFGISIIVFGFSTWFWLSMLALFFSGMADGISMVIRQTILQLKTPDEMRGRVASVNSIFTGSSNELGSFESGVMAKLLGTSLAVIVGGSLTLVTVVATAIGFPKLRKLDLQGEVEEAKV